MNSTIKDTLRQGLTAHKEGKLKEAERLYRAVLKLQPSHPVANYNLGMLAASVEKFGIALSFLKTALQADPKTHQFWTGYIGTLVKDEQFEKAQEVLEVAKTQHLPANIIHTWQTQIVKATQAPNVRKNISAKQQFDELEAHFTKGQFSKAEMLAQSLCEQFPKIPFSWKVLGVLQKRSGRIRDALFSMETSVRLGPEDAEAHTNLGNILQGQERFEDAKISLKRAILLNPGMFASYYNLGLTLLKLGLIKKSETIYRRVILLKGDHIDALKDLYYILSKSNRPLLSLNILRRIYILTLSQNWIENIQRFELKQGYLKNYAQSHSWYYTHLGKESPIRRMIDIQYKIVDGILPDIKKELRNIRPQNNFGIPYLENERYNIVGDTEYVKKFYKILKFIYPKKIFYIKKEVKAPRYFITLECLDSNLGNSSKITVPVSDGHPASFWSGIEKIIQNDDVTTPSVVSAMFALRSVLGLNYLKAQDLQRIQTDPRKQDVLDILADPESCASYDETITGSITQRYLSYYSNIINHTQYFDYISYRENAVVFNIGVAEGFELPALLQFFGDASKIYNIDPDGYSKLTPASRDCVDHNPQVFDLLSVAVSDNDGTLEMDMGFMPEDARIQRRNTGKIKSVPCNRLSSIVDKVGTERVDLIKIDIEGGEEFILDDLISVAKKYRPEICLSIYHKVDHVFDMPIKMARDLSDYKFYFKRYSPLFEEATLYCIPS